MHLASINSEEEQKNLQEHIQSFGKNKLMKNDHKYNAHQNSLVTLYFKFIGADFS